MAHNSTWFEVTNEVLRLALLPTVLDEVTFDSDSSLQEFQFAAKYYVRLCHKLMTLRLIKHFAQRRIELPISAGTAIYALDLGINASCIRAESFFNYTAGGTNNGPLAAMDAKTFERLYPDPSLLANNPGAPTNWVLLDLERSEDPSNNDTTPNGLAVQKVRIVPTPDANYSLQYRAQILPYPLTKAKDVILWPVEYEHALWLWAWAQTERALGEGKEGNLEYLARQAVQEVELVAGKPDDLRPTVKTMKGYRGTRWLSGRYTGWVDSPLG